MPASTLEVSMQSATALKSLSAQERTTLKDVLRKVNAQLGISLLRQVAKEAGLLGKEAKRADGATLKRLVADADQLTKLLAEALDDRGRQASAVRTLQRIALTASQDPTLDHRAHNAFSRVRQAFETGEWEQLKRSAESLRKIRDETPHELLDLINVLIAFLSGDIQRILHALESPLALPSGPLQPPSRPVGASGTRHKPPEEAPAPAAPPPASEESHRARLAEYRACVQALCAGLRASIEKLPTRERLALANTRLQDATGSLASISLESFGSALDLGRQLQTLGSRIAESIQHLSDASASVEQEAHQLASAVGKSLGTVAPFDCTLMGLAKLPAALEAEVARCEKQVEALFQRLGEASLDGSIELLPPPDASAGAQGLLERIQQFDRNVATTLKARANGSRVEAPGVREEAPAPRSKERDIELRFRVTGAVPALMSAGLLGRLREEARHEVTGEVPSFLPVDGRANEPVLVQVPASASDAAAVNAAARNLLVLWGSVARADTPIRPLAQCLEFLGEAAKLQEVVRKDPMAPHFDVAVAAMALHCAALDRLDGRGRRRLAGVLSSRTPAELERGLLECAEAASKSPALARACAELVAPGLHLPLAQAVGALARTSAAVARRLLDGIGIAAALVGRDKSLECRNAVLQALGAEPQDSETIEDFLDDAERQSRRGARPDVPKLKSLQPLVTDFVAAMGSRLWERGRGSNAAPKPGIALPKAAEKGLSLTPGARFVEVPIRVRNGGDAAVGGISILVSRPAKGDSPISSAPTELHVSWLSDQNLEDTSSVVIACRLELDPDKAEQFSELRLSLRSSWFGGGQDESYVLPLRFEERALAEAEITGFNGEPVDLNDEKTFRLSSSSVQTCFKKLRGRLRQGRAVRAVIFGRRRRGKSSICASLEGDREIQKLFSVRRHVWNGPRMTTAATAFSTLSELLVEALARSGVDAAAMNVTDLSRADEMSQRFLHWFDRLSESLKEKTRVLLLLDEFQKWIAGLGSKQERLALLAALRHFNERSGKLEVAFVLSGLQSLKGLVQESTDLANAVESFEVKELTNEEADRYLRERVPLELDGRTRRRLISLSGGNPYVLNRLGGLLVEMLRHQQRSWCTVADADALLLDDDAQTGRLAEFVKYMLHEDEDDGAATLRQLTVLRAVASTLNERGDFDGYVRITDVDAWLQRNSVEFEPGEPQRQLDELAQMGLIQTREGGRHYLRGEWLCRQLAALDPEKVKLQPVTSRPDPDLVLGRYRKRKFLDKGGEAEIWLAENVQEGGHDVVLRIYPEGTVGLHERIEREKKVLSRIRHPNVVGFLGASIDDRHGGVVVLNYINGETLESVLGTKPASAQTILPGGDVVAQVHLLKKIVDAVGACHAENIVHKDLSPRNIMVAQQMGVWEPTLIDFGIAGFDTQPVQDGTTALGTPGYIAPEKALGGRRTPPADIYSLGALFLRVLTGCEPREAFSTPERLERLLEEARMPTRLASLLLLMLSRDPEQRPSASEVRGSLETVLEPHTWKELREKAGDAFLDNREDDAIRLFGQTLSSIPAGERKGADYVTLLGDAADALAQANQPVPWDTQWLDKWVVLMRTTPELGKGAQQIPAVLKEYRVKFPQEGARLIRQLASALAQPPASPALVPLLREVAREDLFREADAATATFEALARYYSENHLDVVLLEDFGVRCARHSRVRLQQPLTAELWLQRVRRLGQQPRADYDEELKALTEARRKTGKLQTLPEAKKQEPMKVGVDERGHLVMSKLEEFDSRIRNLFPFVYRLERVTKDRNAKASRPTLLRLDNIARHLPQGSQDPGNIIPLVLDGSFTAEGIPLRMNIVLPAETTSSQRDAALNVLKEAVDIFDFHG
nr:serine/threonine protein kinase [Myxococcus sp. MH1]